MEFNNNTNTQKKTFSPIEIREYMGKFYVSARGKFFRIFQNNQQVHISKGEQDVKLDLGRFNTLQEAQASYPNAYLKTNAEYARQVKNDIEANNFDKKPDDQKPDDNKSGGFDL